MHPIDVSAADNIVTINIIAIAAADIVVTINLIAADIVVTINLIDVAAADIVVTINLTAVKKYIPYVYLIQLWVASVEMMSSEDHHPRPSHKYHCSSVHNDFANKYHCSTVHINFTNYNVIHPFKQLSIACMYVHINHGDGSTVAFFHKRPSFI
ncbi:unnamed protein product [Mytilus coruscus]|uniref:Uncharacterized protein n=1 Tax=Mytilus coruscus TaxID=42192 RepID=A0A6J8B446_MYTCO|nr:unnamed protein product [Mytilus coruscus]